MSASWLMIGSVVIRLFGIINIIVLARLLTPNDFGLVALAMIGVGISIAFVNRQFDLILIRTPDPDRDHFDTAFSMSIIWGTVCSLGIILTGLFFIYSERNVELGYIFLSIFILPFLDGIKSPTFVKFEKENNLLPSVIVDVCTKSIQMLVSIGFAVVLQNYWALIIGVYFLSVTRLVMTYIYSPFMPSIRFVHFKTFFGAGVWLSCVGIVGYFLTVSDKIVVAAFMTTAAVGVLNVSLEILRMSSDFVANSIARAVYPAMARIHMNKKQSADAYIRAQGLLLAVMFPMGFGMALVAPEFVGLFLGPKWSDAILLIQILAPVNSIGMCVYVIQPLIVANNDNRILFQRNLVVLCVFVLSLIFLVPLYGLIGSALASVAAILTQSILSISQAQKYTDLGVFDHLSYIHRTIVSCIVMSLVVLMFTESVNDGFYEQVVSLSKKAIIGALVYVSTHYLLWILAGKPGGAEETLRKLITGMINGRRNAIE